MWLLCRTPAVRGFEARWRATLARLGGERRYGVGARRWCVTVGVVGWVGLVASMLAACAPGAPDTPAVARKAAAAAEAARTLPARWWLWAASIPGLTNPISDKTGAHCPVAQPTDVWFLAGSYNGNPVHRRCSVPRGRPIYFPVVNEVLPIPPGTTAAGTLAQCRRETTPDEATVEFDGATIATVAEDTGTAFNYTGDGNSPAYIGTDIPAVACGTWTHLPAPAAGQHRLHIRGTALHIVIDVAYDLTITP
jgi:hypothetical protein